MKAVQAVAEELRTSTAQQETKYTATVKPGYFGILYIGFLLISA